MGQGYEMKKFEQLKENLKKLDNIAIAFSGGVDSTFLMAVAHDVLGPENVMGFFVLSPLNPKRDRFEVQVLADMQDWDYETIEIDPWEIEEIGENSSQRCYYCKKAIFTQVIKEAKKLGYKTLADGTNLTDDGDFRPGIEALEELEIISPLREVGLNKEDIRTLSKEIYDLPTWNKPSSACLASRIPYGTPLTLENLEIVDEAEDYLHNIGYMACRVRYHGNLARIELNPKDFERFMKDDRKNVQKAFERLGFVYVALDIMGYRSGSTNLVLEEKE